MALFNNGLFSNLFSNGLQPSCLMQRNTSQKRCVADEVLSVLTVDGGL